MFHLDLGGALDGFFNAMVGRRSAELEASKREAQIDYEWRIHQLQHKVEASSRDLAEAHCKLRELEAEAAQCASVRRRKDSTIFKLPVVVLVGVLSWLFSAAHSVTSEH